MLLPVDIAYVQLATPPSGHSESRKLAWLKYRSQSLCSPAINAIDPPPPDQAVARMAALQTAMLLSHVDVLATVELSAMNGGSAHNMKQYLRISSNPSGTLLW